MSDELVKRLRARAKRENDYYEHGGDIINEAADAIEALQKNVAYWQAQLTKSMCGETLAELEKPRWVSVTERLPKYGERVLVFGGVTMYVAYYDKNRYGVESWHKLNSKSHYCNPSHWMPLPPAPKLPKGEN